MDGMPNRRLILVKSYRLLELHEHVTLIFFKYFPSSSTPSRVILLPTKQVLAHKVEQMNCHRDSDNKLKGNGN